MPSHSSSQGRAHGTLVAALCVLALALTGCAHRKLMLNSPVAVYKQAKKELAEYDYNSAIKLLLRLTAVYPFSMQARQAQLDLIFAYYRAGQNEAAINAANTFIQQHPTQPRCDYAWYMKGVVDFPHRADPIERVFGASLSKRPPLKLRKSFDDFRTVIERYPHSIYAHDAWQRMIYLRDRLAAYDVYVARYYYMRSAYVAAARRTKMVLNRYQGAPATRSALALMILSYRRLGLKIPAAQAQRVYEKNFKGSIVAAAALRHPHWWRFW